MTSPIDKLNSLIPNGLTSNSTSQKIIDATYSNNLGNNLLNFIQQLELNIMRRNKGGSMCVPRVTWVPTTAVVLNCNDNLTLYGALGNSMFLRIANVYANNVQVHKKYLYMKSQGKMALQPLKPVIS
jgi:hypothetical protein